MTADGQHESPLAAFVPRLAVELGAGPVPSWTSVDGSMLSADISGFTALSEKLAGKGKAGAEEITELINTCFTALIDSAYRYGGEVLKFGGDALLILFRGDHHERRCADAGLLMQRALHSSSAAKRANLTMTVGAAAGPFDVFLVGSGYRELLVTGPRATEVIRLEGEAAKGDTLVDPLIAERLPDSMKLRQEHGGWVITGSTGDEEPGPRERSHDGADLTPYVPAAVVEQLEAFASLGGEHRLVTVGFLMVTGVERILADGPEQAAAALDHLVDEVIEVTAQFGVTALHTDIAADGIKFVLCAGAPVNPGDTSDAMLQAALRLARIDSPFTLRQGVQAGRVFAGFLGSEHRRTYTLMGDPVNTAARMLGKAGHRDVVAVASVVEDTRTVFVSEPLEPFFVKGKTEPVHAHAVLAASDQVRRDTSGTTLVGRQHELDTLTHAIGELGEVVILSGSAGVGKSRLLDAAWAASEGLTIFQGACTPYGAASPYSVFRPLLRMGSGIDIHADPHHTGELLEKIVRQAAPQLSPMLPLLAVPFGAVVAPTPEADAVDPQFRRARTHDVVVEFIDSTLDGPVLLVAEDLHWIDDASGELLNHLLRAAASRPWAGILTRRPEGHWAHPDDLDHVRVLHLEPLDDAAIRELTISVSPRDLSDAEVDLVVSRAAGNPLFAIELSRAVSRNVDGELPDSVEGLIANRIDGLAPHQRHLLRVASVFGRQFDTRHLASLIDDADVTTDGLGEMVEHTEDTRFRFRHALYRDVAYGSLPFRDRQQLHARTARLLEADVDDPSRVAAVLSLHFSAARLHRPAYEYSVTAAREAAEAFAHVDAIEFYERALDAGRHCADVDDEDRIALLEQLGRAKEFSGDLVGAEAAYRRITRSSDDVDLRVNCLRRRARVRQKQNRLTAAIRLLRRAERLLPESTSESWALRRRAELHLNVAGLRMDQGRLAEARREGELALECANAADDDALKVQAYAAIVGAITDWSEAEPYADLGLSGPVDAGTYEARSLLATNLGMSAYFAGRWDRAVELYEIGRDAAERMGNVPLAAAAAMNGAEIMVEQGHFSSALVTLAEVRRIFSAAGYASALLYADLLHATATTRSGGDAISVLERCADQFRRGSMQLYTLETQIRLAEALAAKGASEQAEDLLLRTLEESAGLARQTVVDVRVQRQLGLLDLRAGRDDAARNRFLRAIERARDEDLQYELALSLAASVSAFGPESDPDDESGGIFRQLGVEPSGYRFVLAQ